MRVLDLFAGAGGIDQGLRLLGLHDAFGIDHSKHACATARAAGHERIHADIAAYTPNQIRDFGPVDGICAGPPCQSWSRAGHRKGVLDQPKILGLLSDVDTMLHDRDKAARCLTDIREWEWHDPRSPLVLEPLRWLLVLDPSWLMCEQVPDALPLWQAYVPILTALGYQTWTGVLSAERWGVPQTRQRGILTAHRIRPQTAPPPTHMAFELAEGEPVLFEPLPECVSMQTALSWGLTDRPAYTVTGGGLAAGERSPSGTRRGRA